MLYSFGEHFKAHWVLTREIIREHPEQPVNSLSTLYGMRDFTFVQSKRTGNGIINHIPSE